MVLDLGDFRSSLSAAERETRRTVAAIERDSKTSITSIRGGLLGGIGSGGSLAELRQFKQEQMVLARSGPREKFDAQIGGGASAAAMSRYKSEINGVSSAFSDVFAKAWAAKEALQMAFHAGSAAINVFRGDVESARKALETMPTSGWANKAGLAFGEWFADTFVEKDVYKNRDKALAQEKDIDKDRAAIRRQQEEKRRLAEFDRQTRRMLDEAQIADVSPENAAAIRKRMFIEDQTAALDSSGVSKDSPLYRSRQVAISTIAAQDEIRTIKELEDRKAKEQKDAADKRADELKEKEAQIQAETERRSAAVETLGMNREARYIERQRQSRYDPMGGNAALASQTLTRVPGAGNVATVEDKKMIAATERSEKILRDISRNLERSGLAVAEL